MWFASFSMPESPGPEKPLAESRFYAFSPTSVPTISERRPHRNVPQPKEGA